jgi:GNAT superfamily N-acetyltransferase
MINDLSDTLKIDFIPTAQIPFELDRQIEQIDHLAFSANASQDTTDPEPIDWSSPIEWMALGWINDELVTLLGLLQRQILVGGEPLQVVGVGGVATHPNWQGRGLSSALLQVTGKFMRQRFDAPFGLLVCGEERRRFYGRAGWQYVASQLTFRQDDRQRIMEAPVMILPLAGQDWPPGAIDLCGLPW